TASPPFFFSTYGDHLHLPSFPTRRSSDLVTRHQRARTQNRSAFDHRRKHVFTHARHPFRPSRYRRHRDCRRPRLGGSSSRFRPRSEEHTSELQSRENLVCRLLLEKKKITP